MFFDDEEYHDNNMAYGGRNAYGPPTGMYGMPAPPPNPQQEAQREAALQQARREGQQRTQYMEIAASAGIIFFISLNLIVYQNEPKCGHFQTWLIGSLCIYTCDLIMCMNQLMQVKKLGRENLWLLLLMVIILTVNTSWYIWGNILYYRNWETCSQISDAYPIGQNPGITNAVRFMIFIGYITFCKCCLVSCLACIGIPCLCYHYRRQTQPQWDGVAPDLLKRLARTKFEPDPESGSATECCVCLVEFEAQELVITLPCNSKHVFHDACVKKWLEQNNSCPLCKAPITQQALQAQRASQT